MVRVRVGNDRGRMSCSSGWRQDDWRRRCFRWDTGLERVQGNIIKLLEINNKIKIK